MSTCFFVTSKKKVLNQYTQKVGLTDLNKLTFFIKHIKNLYHSLYVLHSFKTRSLGRQYGVRTKNGLNKKKILKLKDST